MNEKKKIIVLLCAIAAVILLIVVCSFIENKKSKKYLNEFYSAFNGSEEKLVMIGRDNCSWCQLFKPSLDSMHLLSARCLLLFPDPYAIQDGSYKDSQAAFPFGQCPV